MLWYEVFTLSFECFFLVMPRFLWSSQVTLMYFLFADFLSVGQSVGPSVVFWKVNTFIFSSIYIFYIHLSQVYVPPSDNL